MENLFNANALTLSHISNVILLTHFINKTRKTMKKTIKNRMRTVLSAIFFFVAAMAATLTGAFAQMPVKNVVLVHGAFADGSGFKALYFSLVKKGYNEIGRASCRERV